MAKVAKSYSFSNAMLYRAEDGSYLLSEFTKEDTKDYDFTEILDGLLDHEGLSIIIKQSAEVKPLGV